MQAPMQSSSPQPPPVYASFGERRSISHDLARFSLDLGPARSGASRQAHTVPYPSPPMSHSPPPLHPLSPKQGARQRPSNLITIPHDTQGMPGRAQEQLSYSHEQQQHLQGPVSATTSSSADSEKFPAPFPAISNGESSHTHLTQVSSTSSAQRSPFATQSSFLPPQLPRRTKSHVASACVNCKKAHLACDGMFLDFSFFSFFSLFSVFLFFAFFYYPVFVLRPEASGFVRRVWFFFFSRGRRSALLLSCFWRELYFLGSANPGVETLGPERGLSALPHVFIR